MWMTWPKWGLLFLISKLRAKLMLSMLVWYVCFSPEALESVLCKTYLFDLELNSLHSTEGHMFGQMKHLKRPFFTRRHFHLMREFAEKNKLRPVTFSFFEEMQLFQLLLWLKLSPFLGHLVKLYPCKNWPNKWFSRVESLPQKAERGKRQHISSF